jgi:6-pyruvoyl tetrahydropterin synthase-like protein
MGFASYKFTFRLNASHSNVGLSSGIHAHTFEITLYMKPHSDAFVTYDKIEKKVQDYLNHFSGSILNAIPPFDETLPTLENISNVFFANITKILSDAGYQLLRLEISESPNRSFCISEGEMTEQKMARLNKSMDRVLLIDTTTKSKENSLETPRSNPEDVADTDQSVQPKSSPIAEFLPLKNISPMSNANFLLLVLITIMAGIAIMLYVNISGIYPLGLDIHGHLFKSDLMYHEILKGNWYPLYTEFWYNGVQPFRYWAPMPYYCLAFLQMIGGGSVMNAYILFIGLSFSVGGIGWLLFARKLGRPWLGLFFALTWFFFPDNIRVFFGEGNLPRMFIAMLLPYIFYCLWQFVCYRRKKMIIPLILLMPLAILGHLMIAAMIGVGTTIFLFIYSVANKRFRESLYALFAMLFTFALSGFWVYPALVGGLTSMSSDATSAVMASTSESLLISLNPFLRLDENVGSLYFSLIIVIISLIGLFLSNKKGLPGFSTFLIIVIGTSTAMTPLILLLPLSQYFWVSRFTPIVYAMFVIAVIEWRSLKRPILIAMCILLLLDFIPSASLSGFDRRMNMPATLSAIPQSMDTYLLSSAKESTLQRVSLMDLSYLGPMPSYAFGTLEPKTP